MRKCKEIKYTHTHLEYRPTPSNFTVMIKIQALYLPLPLLLQELPTHYFFFLLTFTMLHLPLQYHILAYCLNKCQLYKPISPHILERARHSSCLLNLTENAPTAFQSCGLNENNRALMDSALPRVLNRVLLVLSTLRHQKSVCYIA